MIGRDQGDGPWKTVPMLGDNLCHRIIGDPCQFRRLSRFRDPLKRRPTGTEDLHEVVVLVQDAEAGVQIDNARIEFSRRIGFAQMP